MDIYWLVVSSYPSEKMMDFVSWDDDIHVFFFPSRNWLVVWNHIIVRDNILMGMISVWNISYYIS